MRKQSIWRLILVMMQLATLPLTMLAGRPSQAAPPVRGGYSTVVYARLFSDDTDVTANADYEVTALMDGVSRATARIQPLSDGGSVLVFRIWGEVGTAGADETGQTITFLMHDRSTSKDYDVTPDRDITFQDDYTYGSPSHPVALRFEPGQGIPIEALRAKADHIIVYQSEGDIRERLDSLITVLPAESKQKFHWEVVTESALNLLTINESTGDIDAHAEGEATVMAVANADPSICSEPIRVRAINPARTLFPAQEEYIVYLTGQETIDISDDLNSFIIIGPRNYSTININYTSSDPQVVSTRYDEGRRQQQFLAHKEGSAVITTALTYLDCYTETDTTITIDITVYVSLPLTGVTVSGGIFTVCRDSVAWLTLSAEPEGAVLTADNINLTIADTRLARLGDFEVEDGVSSVEVPIVGLFPGKTSISNALQPDGQAQTLSTLDVVVPMQLHQDWQWVSRYVPTAISGEALEAAFGNDLTEVRSQTATLFNDPDYGYIGSLLESGLHDGECYKINMAADASYIFEQTEGSLKPYTGGYLSINNTWTWMANPYYCNHPIEDYVTGAGDEDMIVGQDGFAVYSDGEWFGSLKALRYGEAYMYNAYWGYASLHFKAEGYESDYPVEEEEEEFEEEEEDEEEEEEANETYESRPSYRTPKPHQSHAIHAAQPSSPFPFTTALGHRFRDNMCMIAALGEGFTSTDDCQIAAFVGEECRGTSTSQAGRFFITVHGNGGETVSFRIYDAASGTCSDIQGSTELQPRVGSMNKPLLIRRGQGGTPMLDGCESAQTDGYYTLQGIRLTRARQKGLYIHQGRKVIVR